MKPVHVLGFEVAATLLLLAVFLLVHRLASGETVRSDLTANNTARSILRVGHVLAVLEIATSTVAGGVTGESVLRDAGWVAAFGVTGVVLLEATGRFGVKVLLRTRLPTEIERGNVAAGLAAAAHYAATGYIIARNLTGNDLSSLGLALAFFVLAQLSLHLVVVLFRALTSYDDAEEIVGGNVAAAMSYAGLTMAVGIIVGHAAEGQFVSWGASLKGYGLALLFNLALYPVRQLVVQGFLLGARPTLRAGRLDEGVGRERNVGMGALEAIAYLCTALAVARLG